LRLNNRSRFKGQKKTLRFLGSSLEWQASFPNIALGYDMPLSQLDQYNFIPQISYDLQTWFGFDLYPQYFRPKHKQCRGSVFQCSVKCGKLAWQYRSPLPEVIHWNKKLEASEIFGWCVLVIVGIPIQRGHESDELNGTVLQSQTQFTLMRGC